jgi:tetratricopeptide (TPR) repeat protein
MQGEIEVLLEVGETYLLNKEYTKAIVKFSEALKINPHDPEIYYYLGLAYEGAQKLPAAIEMYKKTLCLDGNFCNAQMRLNELDKQTSKKKDKK